MDYTEELQNGERPAAAAEQKKPGKTVKIKKEDIKRLGGSAKELLKKVFTKKTIIIAAVVAVILAGAILGIGFATNNYMTPVRYAQKQANMRSLNGKKAIRENLTRLGVKNAGEIVKIMFQSDAFLDEVEELQDYVEERYEAKQDAWGDNFRIKYSVEDKIELEKSDLREYRNTFRQTVRTLQNALEYTEDYDSDDWEDLAEELDLSRTQTKKLVAVYREMLEKIDRVEVTAGYELDVLVTVTGDMLEEPGERNITLTVLKVNGRWITASDWHALGLVGDFEDSYPFVGQIPITKFESRSPAATTPARTDAPADATAAPAPAPAPRERIHS